MSDGESLKLRFALDVEDGWPPVSVEGIWCAVDDGAYRVENAPFFIHGLAFGDRFQAEPDPVNGLIFEFTLLAASGHSLAWVLASEQKDFTDFRQALLQIGCRVEAFKQFSLHAVDIPPQVAASAINALVDRLEQDGFPLGFPVWRHDA